MNDLDALAVSRQLGAIEATLDGIQAEMREHKDIVNNRFDKHGIRVGELEKLVATHLQQFRNGNGWKAKAVYGGSSAGGAVLLWELLKLFLGG